MWKRRRTPRERTRLPRSEVNGLPARGGLRPAGAGPQAGEIRRITCPVAGGICRRPRPDVRARTRPNNVHPESSCSRGHALQCFGIGAVRPASRVHCLDAATSQVEQGPLRAGTKPAGGPWRSPPATSILTGRSSCEVGEPAAAVLSARDIARLQSNARMPAERERTLALYL